MKRTRRKSTRAAQPNLSSKKGFLSFKNHTVSLAIGITVSIIAPLVISLLWYVPVIEKRCTELLTEPDSEYAISELKAQLSKPERLIPGVTEHIYNALAFQLMNQSEFAVDREKVWEEAEMYLSKARGLDLFNQKVSTRFLEGFIQYSKGTAFPDKYPSSIKDAIKKFEEARKLPLRTSQDAAFSLLSVYYNAECLHRLGDNETALKMIDIVESKGYDGEVLKDKFGEYYLSFDFKMLCAKIAVDKFCESHKKGDRETVMNLLAELPPLTHGDRARNIKYKELECRYYQEASTLRTFMIEASIKTVELREQLMNYFPENPSDLLNAASNYIVASCAASTDFDASEEFRTLHPEFKNEITKTFPKVQGILDANYQINSALADRTKMLMDYITATTSSDYSKLKARAELLRDSSASEMDITLAETVISRCELALAQF